MGAPDRTATLPRGSLLLQAGSFTWLRGGFRVEGEFRGDPGWERLLASKEGCTLLACARDYPLLPPGVHVEPNWRAAGGVLVAEWERCERYDAHRALSKATTPVYQEFARLPLNHEGALRGFLKSWGPPLCGRHGPEGEGPTVIECPVMVLQYHAYLMWLSLQLIAVVRRGDASAVSDILRWRGPYGDLHHLHSPPHTHSHKVFLRAISMTLLEKEHFEQIHIRPISALRLAAGLLQSVFMERLSPSYSYVRSHSGFLERATGGLPRPLPVPVTETPSVFNLLVPEPMRRQHYAKLAAFFREGFGVQPVLHPSVDAKGKISLERGWLVECLLQRLWLQALEDVNAGAFLAKCACGCNTWFFPKGRRRAAAGKGKQIWLPGHKRSHSPIWRSAEEQKKHDRVRMAEARRKASRIGKSESGATGAGVRPARGPRRR